MDREINSGDGGQGRPEIAVRLLEDQQVVVDPTAADLREMAKLEERPNVAGVAAYAVRHPLPAGWDPELDLKPRTGRAELTPAQGRSLTVALKADPVLAVRGWLAGASPEALAVELLVPMAAARLAAAGHALLWPLAEGPAATDAFQADLTVFLWPGPLMAKSGALVTERMLGYWPEERFALLIGHDDPNLLADLLWDYAGRVWEEERGRGRLLEVEGRARVTDEARGEAAFEPIERESAPAGEWLASLDTMLEAEGRLTPLFAAAAMPAECLDDPAWREAALAVDAILFGVRVSGEGAIGEAGIGSLCIVPREALPEGSPRRRSYLGRER